MKKVLSIAKLTLSVLLFSLFGCVYFMGIVTPSFPSPYDVIYRGIGCGFCFLIYFQLIPIYTKKFITDVRYAGGIVSLISAVITVILLFLVFPLQT